MVDSNDDNLDPTVDSEAPRVIVIEAMHALSIDLQVRVLKTLNTGGLYPGLTIVLAGDRGGRPPDFNVLNTDPWTMFAAAVAEVNEETISDVGTLLLRVVQCTKVVGGVVACNADRPVSIITEINEDDLKSSQFHRSDGFRILCVA